MDFAYPPEAEAFRAEFRAWLDAHLTERFRGLRFSTDPSPDELERMHEWNALLAGAGYAAIAWPPEYGGRGSGLMEQLVWAEEMDRAEAPGTLNPIGIANIAPAIIDHGTDEQKRRFLPAMLRGDDIWCQGFSEPEAGSDLASLRTAAVRDGDHYVVNGQKVWTTLGHLANWCELLVRTAPLPRSQGRSGPVSRSQGRSGPVSRSQGRSGPGEAPKHRGISCLLVDMTLPGVEVRPLVTITGEREFNEIFLTDVRVPVDALLGTENEGWRVAITTLAHERAGVANLHLRVRRQIRRLLDLARATEVNGRPASEDPVLRQHLARVYLEGEYLRLLADRAISAELHGRPAGPESSVAKLHWSDLSQRLAQVAGEVLGPGADAGEWGRERVYVRALSIAGGTTEVNKNVVAERVLGLPRWT